MVIHMVKFKSGLAAEEAERIMRERLPQFQAMPGLIQKYYGREKATGEYTGIYIWDCEESLEAFKQSELARTIPIAYQAVTAPRIELYELLTKLRD